MYTQHHFQSHYKTSPMKNSNQNLMMSRELCLKQIENGMRLGTFLSELGWLQDSLKVLVSILNVINTLKLNYNSIIVKLDCLQRWVSFVFLKKTTKNVKITIETFLATKTEVVVKFPILNLLFLTHHVFITFYYIVADCFIHKLHFVVSLTQTKARHKPTKSSRKLASKKSQWIYSLLITKRCRCYTLPRVITI